MSFYSTRDVEKRHPVTASQAIKQGLCDDGGLFMPDRLPQYTPERIREFLPMSYPERAAAILSDFLDDYTYDELYTAACAAYSDEKFVGGATDIAALGEHQRVLELWHGPTCAFKDMALQIMPHLLTLALRKNGEARTALILVATSGDTGKAALEGYRDVDGVKITVFYPEDGVSRIQKLQMASQLGENVYVCAIRGNFDDAQTGVKTIFSDKEFAAELDKSGLFLSSANSINWGRLAPQIVYYISAYCDLINNGDIGFGDPIDITVPTGNFGNIFAAYLAKCAGLPFSRLICASNRNNVLTDFLTTGVYDRNRAFYTTTSPSMDILISSNLERLLYTIAGPEKCVSYMNSLAQTGRYEVDSNVMDEIRKSFAADFCTEEQTAETIRYTFDTYSYLIDTHTACALYASYRAEKENAALGREVKILTASTASPYKFAADVLRALGEQPTDEQAEGTEIFTALFDKTSCPVPAPLAALKNATVRFSDVCEKNAAAMKERCMGKN